MKNKIDQFFKDKLERHTVPPSEEAWSKVEANLSKKNNSVVWRMAAAVLTAGALITVMIWSQRGSDQQPAIAANQLPKDNSIKEQPTPKSSSIEKSSEVKSAKKLFTTPQVQQTIPNKAQNNKSVTTTDHALIEKKFVSTEESTAAVEKNKTSSALTSEGRPEENSKQDATPPATIASTHQKSIKLEFTLEDFSSAPPVATVSEAKSSGLKKVWEMAREVKNGDGHVREIKNELFALNFRKNKNQ